MEETRTLKDELKDLNSHIKLLIDSGKFKEIKGKKKLSKRDIKKGFIRYIYINENNSIKVLKVPIEESTTLFEKVPRIATPDYMLSWDGQPTIIQPSWSVKPFSPVDNWEDTVKERMTSAGHRLLLNKIEQGGIIQKKKMSGAVIFGIIIVLIIAGYLLLSR